MTAAPLATPREIERGLVRALKASGSSFYWAIRLLPRHKRNDLATIYLFCRLMDDIADGDLSDLAKEQALKGWKTALQDGCAPPPPATLEIGLPCPLFPLLQAVMERHQINPSVLIEIIDGVRMDLGQGIQAPDAATFTLYCRRVAGYVGVATVRVLGGQGPQIDRFALTTGDALQATNILRDVVSDARQGRLYLPAPLLARHGLGGLTAAQIASAPTLGQACHDLAQETEQTFDKARGFYRALPRTDRHRLRPAFVMLSSYRLLLKNLQRRGWDLSQLDQPCRPSRLRLLGDALAAWASGR
jgi:phytoene synthase